MEKSVYECRKCQRKTHQNISNRCQYCGAALPEQMKMTAQQTEAFKAAQEQQQTQSNEFAAGLSKESVVDKEDRDANILMTLGTRDEAGEWNEGSGSHLFNQPNEVALDSQGNFYVAQGHGAGEPRVLKFTAEGKFIKQWGSRGDGPNQLAFA